MRRDWEPPARAAKANTVGVQPLAKAEGRAAGAGAGGTVGMQPSRKREGKPVGEGSGNTVGMQPSRKREGKPAGEGSGNTVGMQPSRKREGKPVGEGSGNTVGVQPSARAEGRAAGAGAGGTVGPSRKRERKPVGKGAGGMGGTARSRALRALRSRLGTRCKTAGLSYPLRESSPTMHEIPGASASGGCGWASRHGLPDDRRTQNAAEEAVHASWALCGGAAFRGLNSRARSRAANSRA
jgi:hypothetical protein